MEAMVSTFLINARDSGATSAKIGLPATDSGNALAHASLEKLTEYMRPWLETVTENCRAAKVVLHDGLPSALCAAYPAVEFVRVEAPGDESAWVKRFRMLRHYLLSAPRVRRVFVTDINDVGVFRDPFQWLDEFELPREMLVAGEEWKILGENRWFTDTIPILPAEMRLFFESHLMAAGPVTCGVWGGPRQAVLDVLREMVRLFDSYADVMSAHPAVSWDMFAFNYAVFRLERFATFKMQQLPLTHHGSGLTLRGIANPLIHDRPSALSRMDTTERLASIMHRHDTDKDTAHSYGPLYEELLAPLRERALAILEIGVFRGGSLRAWRDYFPWATIHGVDVDANAMIANEARIVTHIARQSDPVALAAVAAQGPFDLIVDDGSHELGDQLASFAVLRPYVKRGGWYVIEDLQSEEAMRVLGQLPGSTIHDRRHIKGRNDDVVAVIRC